MDTLTRYHSEHLTPIALDSIDRVLPGELSLTLSQLGLDYPTQLTQHFNEGLSIATLTKMLRQCPLSHRSIEILALRGMPLLGDYVCPDKRGYYLSRLQQNVTRQEWVQSNWQTMKGSLEQTIGMMMRQAIFYGHSVAEIVYDDRVKGYPNQWRLSKFKILEPEQYYFMGMGGEVDRIIYYSRNMAPIPIPIEKLLVIYIPSASSPEDPYGDCVGARAYPFYLARQLAYKAWTVAGQKQATGHMVFKSRSEKSVQLFDSKGRPLKNDDGTIVMGSAVYAIAQMLKGMNSGEPIVIDKDVDVSTVSPGSGADFFNPFLNHLGDMIYACYGIPSTIMKDVQASLGGKGVNDGHLQILDSQVKGLVDICRQEVVEKVVRPLSVFNFGADAAGSLGEFQLPPSLDPTTSSITVSNLLQGFMQGILDTTDFEAVNRYKELCGLTPQSREEYDRAAQAKYELDQRQAVKDPGS